MGNLDAVRVAGADGASATALQPPPHLLTTLPAPAGGGRCVCHRHPEPSGSVGEPPAGRTRDGLRRVRSPERPSWPRRVRGGPRGLAADVDELGDGEGRRRGEVVAGHGRGSWAARTSCSARGAMAAVRRTPRPSRGHHRRARRAADPVGVREGRGPRRGDVRSRTRADRRRRRPSRPTATGSIQAADAGSEARPLTTGGGRLGHSGQHRRPRATLIGNEQRTCLRSGGAVPGGTACPAGSASSLLRPA